MNNYKIYKHIYQVITNLIVISKVKFLCLCCSLSMIVLMVVTAWSPVADNFTVSLKILTNFDANTVIQLFYTIQDDQQQNFQEQQSVRCRKFTPANVWTKFKCNIELPRHKKIAKLRVDLGSSVGLISIKKFTLMNEPLSLEIANLNNINYSGDLKYQSGSLDSNNQVNFKSLGSDPFFYFGNNLNRRGHFGLSFHNILSLIIMFCITWLITKQICGKFNRKIRSSGPVVVHYKTRQFMNVEVLRFMLVMYVVLEHFGLMVFHLGGKWEVFSNFFMSGRSQLFFVIAGFFLFFSPKQLNNSIAFFSIKRWLRLSSLVIFCTVLAYVIIHFDFVRAPIEFNILNATLLNFINNNDWNLIGVAWYVNSLFFLSVLYFAVYKILPNNYALLFTLFIAAISANLYARGISFGDSIQWRRLPGATFSLSVGILICKAYKIISKSEFILNELNIKTKFIISLMEAFCFVFLFIGLYCKTLGLSLGNNILSVCIIILLWLFICNKGVMSQFLNKPWAIYFGRYTYSIFITHEILNLCYREWIAPYYSEFLKSHFSLTIIIYFAVMFSFAILCHYFVELPLSSWTARKFLKISN